MTTHQGRVRTQRASPLLFALALCGLTIAAVIGIVTLQRYSAAQYRLSVQTYQLGLDAQGLNALSWTALSAIDPVNFPGAQRPVDADLARLDAQLLQTNAHLRSAPPAVRDAVAGYVRAIEEVGRLIQERSAEAYPLLEATGIVYLTQSEPPYRL